MFWLGLSLGACLILGAASIGLWRNNRELNLRLRQQQAWLARLDGDFDRLSLDLWAMRNQIRNGLEPSDKEMKRAEDALVDLLNELMSETKSSIMA